MSSDVKFWAASVTAAVSTASSQTRGHVHLIPASAPASVSPWLSSGSTPSAWSTSPTWSSRSVDIVIPGDIIAVVLLLLWKTTKLIFFCFIRSLSRKSKAIIYIILNVHFDTMYNSRLCSFTPSPCCREPHIWPTNYMLFSFEPIIVLFGFIPYFYGYNVLLLAVVL